MSFEYILENFLLSQSVAQEQLSTTCANSLLAYLVTTGRVLAMDAECGLSLRDP